MHNREAADNGEVCPETGKSKTSCIQISWKKFQHIVLQVQNTREKQM